MAKIRLFMSMVIHFLVFNTESTSIDFKGVWQFCAIIYLWTIQSIDNVYVWLNSYNNSILLLLPPYCSPASAGSCLAVLDIKLDSCGPWEHVSWRAHFEPLCLCSIVIVTDFEKIWSIRTIAWWLYCYRIVLSFNFYITVLKPFLRVY